MALTYVSGTRATASMAATREDPFYMQGISVLANWRNPLTLFTQTLQRAISDTVPVNWFEDQLVPYLTQLNDGSNMTDSDTEMDVDNFSQVAVGDLIEVVRTGEVVLVTANTGSHLTIVREYGVAEGWTSNNAAIVDDDYLRILGNISEQGRPSPTAITTQEVAKINYNGDIRTFYELTDIAINSRQRGEQDQILQDRKKAVEHQESCERINFYGKPYAGDKGAYVAATGNTLPTAAGGIRHYLVANANTALLPTEDELTMFEFMDDVEAAFAKCTLERDAKEKVCICAPKLRLGLEKWGITQQQTFAGQTVMGVPVATWESSFGTIHFITHDLLKAPSTALYNEYYILDMGALTYVTFNNIGMTSRTEISSRNTDGATKKGWEYRTIQCVVIEQCETHLYGQFKTVAAA
ncbi:MAG: hypothetical protein AB1664_00715 [Thermodesulfobacteriota bacterium]